MNSSWTEIYFYDLWHDNSIQMRKKQEGISSCYAASVCSLFRAVIERRNFYLHTIIEQTGGNMIWNGLKGLMRQLTI